MASKNIFASDYQDIPYWWEAAPLEKLTAADLVRSVDVAVIGSGYTGLHAALQTARAGRTTLVIEKELAGHGCSSRNGGQVGTSFKPVLAKLEKSFGRTTAINMILEGHRALAYLKEFIHDEKIDCEWHECGRFVGAHSKKAFDRDIRTREKIPSEIAEEFHVVPRSEIQTEIDSDLFHGGVVLPNHGSLHPGKYYRELLKCVQQAGAIVVDLCPVQRLERTSKGFRLHTKRGTVDATKVILATNGYTQDQFDWHQKRVLPIGSFQIATEILSENVVSKLIPNARVVNDTRLVGNYSRLSPDHKRLLIGGRVTFSESSPTSGSKLLQKQMISIFPQLSETLISYSWVGFIAYTIDSTPHIGVHDNVYYSMGFCGSGITLSSYFGMRIGQKLLGTPEGATALDHLDFKPWPSFVRSSWFFTPAARMIRFAENIL